MMQTFRSVIKEQGPKGLYRGVVTPILAETPKRAWKFTANQQFKNLLAKTTKDGKQTMATTTFAGSLAGITEALINCPFETIKV
jgi:solute carrier family 25 2-oxodicarboxylate transporter 21